ncbi:glycosyltransferase [Kribbella sp. NPDC056861]|uniref:glycosyltransferase n=1 Tax=Kribbella sp. NPDC056861 TaxID=3154857 RepID=UPI0034174523
MIEAAGIVVPAHNEERLIEACLVALRDSIESVQVPVQVCVVADRCTDATIQIVATVLPDAAVLRTGVRRPLGRVRDLGMRFVMEALGRYEPARVWLLGTDADTCVRPDWIERQLAHADAGADAVTGLVDLQPEHHLTAELRSAYRALVAEHIRPGDHGHIHGASFGVRASAYAEVGGYRELDTGEDRDLWFRLQAAGHAMVQPRDLDVLTSPRTTGRARGGLADLLATLITPA